MNKREYLKAVRQAKRVIGYVKIADKKRIGMKISKVVARTLVNRCDDSDKIDAEWADDEQTFLLVG